MSQRPLVNVPAAEAVTLPTLLDLPAPRLRGYPKEAVIAEKLEAMVTLGIRNSRMKDFYDLWVLQRQFAFQGTRLCEAIRATFSCRGTALPVGLPLGLSTQFEQDPAKRAQWRAFLRRIRTPGEMGLQVVLADLRRFLAPPIDAAQGGAAFPMLWTHDAGWQATETSPGVR